MEGEGTLLISMLVEKTGINNATLKDKVIEILKAVISANEIIYPLH
jgi:hypothetical protein